MKNGRQVRGRKRRLALLVLSIGLVLPVQLVESPVAVAAMATTTTVVVHNTKHNVVNSGEVGRAIHPSVTVTGLAGVPSGTVVVQWFSGGSNCTGYVTKQATTTLSSGAVDATALTITPTEPGLISFRATYVGNTTYSPSQDCTGFAVAKALPPNTSAVHDSAHTTVTQVLVTKFVHFNMTLSAVGALPKPTGTIEISRYADAACTQLQTVNTVAVGANGAVETDPTAAPTARSISFRATYQGDSLYRPRTSSCRAIEWVRGTLAVKAAVHTSTHAAASSVSLGSEVHPAVTTSGDLGVASGSVDVRWYDGHDCASLMTIWEEVALIEGASHDPGRTVVQAKIADRSMRVHYNGSGAYNAADSACINWTVVKATPTMSFAIHDPDHDAGTTFQLGTAVHPGGRVAPVNGLPNPTGDVDLLFYGNGSCTGGASKTITGVATVGSYFDDQSATAQATQPGPNSIRVKYLGDARYAEVEKCVAFTVSSPTQPPTSKPSAAPTATSAPAATTTPTAGPGASETGEPTPTAATTIEPGAPSGAVPGATAAAASAPAPSGGAATPAASFGVPVPADAGSEGLPVPLIILVLAAGLVAVGGFLYRRRPKPSS